MPSPRCLLVEADDQKRNDLCLMLHERGIEVITETAGPVLPDERVLMICDVESEEFWRLGRYVSNRSQLVGILLTGVTAEKQIWIGDYSDRLVDQGIFCSTYGDQFRPEDLMSDLEEISF